MREGRDAGMRGVIGRGIGGATAEEEGEGSDSSGGGVGDACAKALLNAEEKYLMLYLGGVKAI